MVRHGITKSAINDYFKDLDLSLFWKLNSFTSVDNLRKKMLVMQDRIVLDSWLTQKLSIESLINGVGSFKYTIFYRNIIKALRFLIEHKGFTHNLAYAPIQ